MAQQISPTPEQRKRTPRLAIAALLFGATNMAIGSILVRISEVGPTASAFWRVALACPLLALTAQITKPRNVEGDLSDTGREKRICILAGLFFAGDLGFWHYSLVWTSITNATLLTNLSPIFVVIGGWLVFRQRVSKMFLAGLVLAVGGMSALMRASFHVDSQHLVGDGMGLVSAVFYGGYLLSIKRARRRFSAVRTLAWSSLGTALVLLPATLFLGEVWLPRTTRGWSIVLSLSLVAQMGGQGMVAFALAHLPAAFSSVTLLFQPAVAAVLAWWLLREPVGSGQILGAMATLAGIWLARRGSDLNASGSTVRHSDSAR